MRQKLRAIGSQERHTFIGEVVRFGWKNGWMGSERTILLKDIRLNDEIVCDHIWFKVGKQFERLSLQPGDKVSFSARVSQYEKGYKGRRWDVFDKPIEKDYRLSFPTQARKISTTMPTSGLRQT